MHRIPVGVLGASGYAGRELCALVAEHPQFELVFATANASRGETMSLASGDVTFVATEDAPLQKAELAFSSLPHGASAEWVARARDVGARVVDLSSDLRPGHAREVVPYGLTELHRDELRDAPLIANPGCYPTAILLALAPLVRQKLVVPGSLIVADAASLAPPSTLFALAQTKPFISIRTELLPVATTSPSASTLRLRE